jgi:DNA polymerase-1
MTPPSDKKLFLLDAFALIYRAYFAFSKNPRINSRGENTSAAFGFTNSLIDIIKKEKPSHIAVVFDAPTQTNRAEEHSFYKAHREEMPEDIRSMIEPIKRIIQAFNIPILLKNGFEADDVIGTLAKEAERRGFTTYMMTPDKDFGQLVSENIFMYKPARMGNSAEILGVKEVCERFEVDNPLKVIDILGLWGDAVDNIPGIPGIGEKTAKKLIAEYGSVENLIAHADDLKGKQKENVINFAEQGLISKKLATIILDVDVEFNEEDLKIIPPNEEAVKEIFTELEFRNLAKRVLGEEIVVTVSKSVQGDDSQLDLFGSQSMVEAQEVIEVSDLKTVATEKPSYHLVTTSEERTKLLHELLQQTSVCFDTETTSIEALDAAIVGLSFSWKKREAYYVAFPADFETSKAILKEFTPFFEHLSIEKIAHNLKYDVKILSHYDIEILGPIFDTMIAHYLIQADGKHNMDFLAEYYLGYKTISIENLIGKKGKNQRSMADLDPREVVDYACEDADITFQLKTIFEPEINKGHLKKLFYEVEMPISMVLKDMEETGINLDVTALNIYSKELAVDLQLLEKGILEDAGTSFNLDSPKQLGEILFEKLKISDKAKKTKTGQYATSEDVLSYHINDHPIIAKILDYRQLRKLKSTYVDALPLLVSPKDGRVHTHYMQTVVPTGRLSSNNPNLQNIPIRSEKGREIRKSFIAKNEDYLLLSADYSQIELRVIAALSDDKNMIAAFKNGEDIHKATAAKVFNVPLEEVSREQRSQAKAVNFGIIYGQSAFGLAQNLGISRTEAKGIIDSYFTQYTRIKEYIAESIEKAKTNGYVETILQRRRYLSDINSSNAIVRGFAERNAINAPIQGSAADIIKLAMINVHNRMKKEKLNSKMLLQVHDELIFDVQIAEQEIMHDLVKTEMENAIKLSVPLIVDVDIARNWLEAH